MDEKKIRKGKSRLTEGKKNIIEALLQEYNLETTEDWC